MRKYTGGPGRTPIQDGRVLKQMTIRITPDALHALREIAKSKDESYALTAGVLIERALETGD